MKKIIIGIVVMLLALTSFSIEAGETKSNYYYAYFNSYSTNQSWSNNPEHMVDGNESSYAFTDQGQKETQLLTSNSFNITNITITGVHLRARAYTSIGFQSIFLVPIFDGNSNGSEYSDFVGTSEGWTDWFNITNDPAGPGGGNWTVDDVMSLDCKVKSGIGFGISTLYCSYVQIRVTGE